MTATPTDPTPTSRTARVSVGKLFAAESSNYYLILGTTIFLVLIGLVMVLSASSVDSWLDDKGFFGGFWKQATWAVIGIPLMLIISRFRITFWKKWAWWLLGASLVLQGLVFSPLGFEDGGNRNWIALGPISAQPSEAVKLALCIWLGVVLGRKYDLLGDWRHVLIPALPVAAIALGLVLAGHDLGTVMIMAGLVFGGLFFANIRMRYLLVPLGIGALMVLVFVLISQNRLDRIGSFFGETDDYEGLDWQPLHGTWALANGGIFGLGLGNSREKYSWLPAASNDYIFAIVGEELGIIGAIVVIGLFVMLTIGFIRVIRSAQDPMVRITTGAIMVWIIGQAVVNIAVVLRILPVLGVPLPMLSAGGTALITSLAAIGVVLSFARGQSQEISRDTFTVTAQNRSI
ncbi:putative lipid II flippase FtsW [Mycetocola spongiae]|uniref:putative lipid II flippase FtsW n=1 Tax=Mycetocola spongiae TaxID=2859226 RepID=UPI001CF39368|nr:putative lipid II flippase FtsW [Mycetocola spongiae]UCR89784.1 putative lipid II flippase FtsW [Mycetocola spongiae]